jgi:membrane protein implicated in regulation of membrane protease activity
MNKLVLNIGLLVFCFSIIFFSQRQLAFTEVLLKSLIIFIVTIVSLSIGAYFVNKYHESNDDSNQNPNTTILGNNNE